MNPKVVLKGSLAFLGLAELLQQLGGGGSTGVLKITSDQSDMPGYIYLKDGNPVDAEYGKVTGIDALNGFFGWREAVFEFMEDDVSRETVIKKGRMELILDGLRMVDEGLIPILGNEPGDGKNSDSDGKRLPLLKGPVVDYVYVVDEEVFENGDEIVAQNRYGTWFWVILEGMVEVVRIFPQGPAPILRLGEGAFIGSIVSFLREGNTRSASIYAVGRVQLGVVDSELIAREYSVLSDMFRNILISLDKRMKQLTDVCAAMVLDQQEPLVDQPRGNLFISRESNEKKVFFIKRGQAFVYKNIKDKYLHLLTLEKGDLIGRIAFLNSAHEPYSAQVYLSEDTEVYPVDLDNLHQEYQELSGTFKNMIRNLTNSISVTTGRIQDIITHSGKCEDQG
jgi:CRP-like cAMP-binding protein